MYGPPPIHPHPGFFETTVAEVADGPVITHHDIEAILARPQWDIRDMQMKVTANLVLRGWTKNEDGVFVAPPPEPVARQVLGQVGHHSPQPKKKPAKKATPKKKP